MHVQLARRPAPSASTEPSAPPPAPARPAPADRFERTPAASASRSLRAQLPWGADGAPTARQMAFIRGRIPGDSSYHQTTRDVAELEKMAKDSPDPKTRTEARRALAGLWRMFVVQRPPLNGAQLSALVGALKRDPSLGRTPSDDRIGTDNVSWRRGLALGALAKNTGFVHAAPDVQADAATRAAVEFTGRVGPREAPAIARRAMAAATGTADVEEAKDKVLGAMGRAARHGISATSPKLDALMKLSNEELAKRPDKAQILAKLDAYAQTIDEQAAVASRAAAVKAAGGDAPNMFTLMRRALDKLDDAETPDAVAATRRQLATEAKADRVDLDRRLVDSAVGDLKRAGVKLDSEEKYRAVAGALLKHGGPGSPAGRAILGMLVPKEKYDAVFAKKAAFWKTVGAVVGGIDAGNTWGIGAAFERSAMNAWKLSNIRLLAGTTGVLSVGTFVVGAVATAAEIGNRSKDGEAVAKVTGGTRAQVRFMELLAKGEAPEAAPPLPTTRGGGKTAAHYRREAWNTQLARLRQVEAEARQKLAAQGKSPAAIDAEITRLRQDMGQAWLAAARALYGADVARGMQAAAGVPADRRRSAGEAD